MAELEGRNRTLFVWGCGNNGRLGLGCEADAVGSTRVEPLAEKRVKQMSAGHDHTVCLLEDGTVLSWGRGSMGCLGLGDLKDRCGPEEVGALKCHRVVSVSAGYAHTVFLTATGQVFTCGLDDCGRLGFGLRFDGANKAMLLPQALDLNLGRPNLAMRIFVLNLAPLTTSPSRQGKPQAKPAIEKRAN